MNKYSDLFLTFARIGGLTFGGGYAMLPMLQREVVEKRGWATEEELMNYYAIGQCTPGIVATFGVAFPSLVIICIITAFIQNFADLPIVQNAFAGIRVCVCVLIFNAVLKLWKKSVVDKATAVICVLILVGSVFTELSPILFVIVAGVLGVILKSRGGKTA